MIVKSKILLLPLIFIPAVCLLYACTPDDTLELQTPTKVNTTVLANPEPAASEMLTAHETQSTPPDMKALMLAYTPEKPLLDQSEIQKIMVFMQRQENAWFANPGWILYRESSSVPDDFADESRLIHLIDANGNCSETMTFFSQNGTPASYSIRLSDGTSAIMKPGEAPDREFIQTPSQSSPCRLENGIVVGVGSGGILPILYDEMADMREWLSGQNQRGIGEVTVSAWFAEVNGQSVFVLDYDQQVNSSYMDADTGILQPINRSLYEFYFNSENGLLLIRTGKYYLNKELVGEWEVTITYQYFETLPSEIERLYLDTATGVAKALEQQ